MSCNYYRGKCLFLNGKENGCKGCQIKKAYNKGVRDTKEVKFKVINRGKCMLCGKELTEGLFFCKECEEKGKGEKQ